MEPDEYHPEEQRKFVDKWSQNIFDSGAFTMIPNLLLEYAHLLGITPSELVILINIESHRWSTKLPYPSVQKLAERTGMSERHVTRLITSLEGKGLIRRLRHRNKTNRYDLYPLIVTLDDIVESVPDDTGTTTRQNRPIETDIIDAEILTPESAKEDTYKQYPIKYTHLINNSHITENMRGASLDIEKGITK